MDDRENRRKILYIALGVIVIILLFFMIKSCGKKNEGIVDDPLAISTIKLPVENMTLTVGDSDKLSYTILPSDTTEATKWMSSNEKVVTVDSKGNIKALNEGNAVITLVSEKGGVFDSVEIKVVSKITEDGTYVTARLLENDVFLKVGSTKKLEYELDPIDSKYIEVSFESNNSLVATVSSDGVVTGVKSGVTSVDVRIVLSDNSVITDTATITVEDNAILYMTSNVPDIKLGETIRLSAALSDSSVSMTEGNVKVSNDNTASISNVSTSNGYLTFDIKGLKAGNATLKLSAITSEGKTLSLDVPIVVVKFSDLYISSGNKELLINNTFTLSGRLEPSVSSSLETECKSSNEKIVTVSSVTPVGGYNGACQITGIKEGSANVTITISGQKKTIKVTVNETEKPDDGSSSDKPGDGSDKPEDGDGSDKPGDGSDKPEDGTGIGSATLSVELDKTDYSINDTAVITVTFTDENGNKKELSSSEYVVATSFDSTSSGTKKLVVVYPYKEESLKAEVSYTVGGGGLPSGGLVAGSGGYGSYPSGSGGGGGGGAGGVDTCKQDENCSWVEFDTLQAINKNRKDDGTYKGLIPVQIKLSGSRLDKDDTVIISFKCKTTQEECDKFIEENDQWVQHKQLWERFEPVSVHLNPDGEINVAGEYIASFSNKKDTWQCEDIKDAYKGEDDCFSKVVNYNENVVHNWSADTMIHLTDKDGEKVTVDSEAEPDLDDIPIAKPGEGGALSVKLSKEWKLSRYEPVDVHISANAAPNYIVSNVSLDSKQFPIEATKSVTVDTSTSALRFTVSVVFTNTKNYEQVLVTKNIEIKIDDKAPVCTVTFDSLASTVTVKGLDDDSGVEKVESVNGLSGTNAGDIYTFILTDEEEYKFMVIDKVGNIGYCSAKHDPTLCYAEDTCINCASCPAAGCVNEKHELTYEYECKKSDKTKIKTIFIPLKSIGEDVITLEGDNNYSEFKAKKYEDPVPTLILDFAKEGTYICNLTDFYDCRDPKKRKEAITDRNEKVYYYDKAGFLESTSDLNTNCAVCGCADSNSWVAKDSYNLFDENTIKPIKAIDGISYLRIYESENHDKCEVSVKDKMCIIKPSGLSSDVLNTFPSSISTSPSCK